MKDEGKAKWSILESIVVICIMSIYIAYGVNYLPLLIFIAPVPFIVLGIRNGLKVNIVSLAITLLIVQGLLSSTSGATLLIAFGPLSFVLNHAIKTRKTRTETILMATASFLLPFVLLILLEGQIANIDIIKEAEMAMNQFLSLQLESLQGMGLTNYELLQTKDQLESLYNELLVLIPSMLSIFSLFIAYVNFSISTLIIRKMGYGVVSKGSFSRFKLPNNIIPGIGIMFLTGFIFRLLKINYHQAFLLNITFLVGFIFLVQGLSVIDFSLKKMKMKIVFRIIILISLLMFVPIGSVIFIIGLFDSIFDVRKIRRKES